MTDEEQTLIDDMYRDTIEVLEDMTLSLDSIENRCEFLEEENIKLKKRIDNLELKDAHLK